MNFSPDNVNNGAGKIHRLFLIACISPVKYLMSPWQSFQRSFWISKSNKWLIKPVKTSSMCMLPARNYSWVNWMELSIPMCYFGVVREYKIKFTFKVLVRGGFGMKTRTVIFSCFWYLHLNIFVTWYVECW